MINNIRKTIFLFFFFILWIASCKSSKKGSCDENSILINKTCYSACPTGKDDACEVGFYCSQEGYCAPGTNRAPVIENINGNGPINTSPSDETMSSNYIHNGLYISGNNLNAVESVLLLSTQDENIRYDLAFEKTSNQLIEAALPENLNDARDLNFELSITSPYGSSRVFIRFTKGLQGDKGTAGTNGPNYNGIQGAPGLNGVNGSCSAEACIGAGFPGASRMMALRIKAGLTDSSEVVSSILNGQTVSNTFSPTNAITIARYNSFSYERIQTNIIQNNSDVDNFFPLANAPHGNEIIAVVSQGDTSALLRTKDISNKTFAYYLTQYGASDALLTLNNDQTFAFVGRNNHIPGTASTYIWGNPMNDSNRSALVFVIENSIFGSHTKQDSFVKTEQIKGRSVFNPSCTNNDIMLVTENGNIPTWNCAQNSVITSDHLQDNAVTTRHFINGNILANHIQNNSVNAITINNNTLTTNILSNQSITGNHIQFTEIINALIANQAVNSFKIANANIIGNHIQNASINSRHFFANTLTERVFSNNVLQISHFSDGSISNRHIRSNNIVTVHIQNNTFGQNTFGNGVLRTDGIGLTITSASNNIYIQSQSMHFSTNDSSIDFSYDSTNRIRATASVQSMNLNVSRIVNGKLENTSFAKNSIVTSDLQDSAKIFSNTCFISLQPCSSPWSAQIKPNHSNAIAVYATNANTNINVIKTTQGNIIQNFNRTTTSHNHRILNGNATEYDINGFDINGNEITWMKRHDDSSGPTSVDLGKRQDDTKETIHDQFKGQSAWTSPTNDMHTHTELTNTVYAPPTGSFYLCCKL